MNVHGRLPIFQATRVVGLTDSELARLLGVSPMAVSKWAAGDVKIPTVRHATLILFVCRFCNDIFNEECELGGIYAKRARLLDEFTIKLICLAFDEIGEQAMAVWKDAADASYEMLTKLDSQQKRQSAA